MSHFEIDIYYFVRNKPGWLNFLERLGYTKEQEYDFEMFDEERKRFDKAEESYYKSIIVLDNKKNEFEFIKEIQKEMPEEIISIKQLQRAELDYEYKDSISELEKQTWAGKEPSYFLIERSKKLLKEIKKNQTETEFLQGKQFIQEGQITDNDILRAKNYPFDTLIDSKKGFCKCPFHEEKTGSLYIKENFGYCFGCGWTGDTIKFVMNSKGIDFIKAVKMLQ